MTMPVLQFCLTCGGFNLARFVGGEEEAPSAKGSPDSVIPNLNNQLRSCAVIARGEKGREWHPAQPSFDPFTQCMPPAQGHLPAAIK
jgi:hypothetical protein